MSRLAEWRLALAGLSPANFGLVMATGILALAADMLGLPWVARALLVLNVVQYALLWLLYLLRALIWPRRCLGDLTDHARGPGYFTVVAATGVLASQLLVQERASGAGWVLGVLTLVLWAAFTYSMFLAFIVKRDKPPFVRGISGSWLLAVVATQSVAVVCALLMPDVAPRWRPALNFLALTLWLWAGVLYLWLMGLIFYRFMFLRLAPEELVPSYWINMGALAISTLAGALLIQEAPQAPWLATLLPFVKGVTLVYWATGSWWIPVLVLLGVWRHGVRRYPFVYEPLYWGLVFPLGMYAACTWQMDRALQLALLDPLARVSLGFGLLAWLLTFAGLARRVGCLLLRSPASRT